VAEWQTRQTQNLLSVRTWEFKSPRPHHINQSVTELFKRVMTVMWHEAAMLSLSCP
jgi:hypothetical protein